MRLPTGICYGRLDVPLAPGWEGWAGTLAARLGDMAPAHIWSSPTSRCADVATALAIRLGLPLTLEPRLQELDFGAWEGVAWDNLPRAALDLWAADPHGFAPPRGESGDALICRVAGFASMLAEEARRCIVVSHGGPLRLLPALLRGERPDLLAAAPELGSLTVVRLRARPAPRGSA